MLYTHVIKPREIQLDSCPECGECDWWSVGVSKVQCRTCGHLWRTYLVGHDLDEVDE